MESLYLNQSYQDHTRCTWCLFMMKEIVRIGVMGWETTLSAFRMVHNQNRCSKHMLDNQTQQSQLKSSEVYLDLH